jgi:hypothetical protein
VLTRTDVMNGRPGHEHVNQKVADDAKHKDAATEQHIRPKPPDTE